jgi:acetylornithine deacetylase
MGRPVEGDIYRERRLTDYLEQLLGQIGLPCQRHSVAEGRDNLIARLDGND